MVKTRGMQEPVTAATEGDGPVSTESATAVGPTGTPNNSVTDSDPTQPHSPGATTTPHRQPLDETRTNRKALARARLELAAARLALLEADSADEEFLAGSSTAASKRQTDAADALGEHRGYIRPPQSRPMSPHDDQPTPLRRGDTRTATPHDAPPPSPQRGDEGSLLKGLTQALLEVARGNPAASRCLKRRTWNHKCKSKQCEVQDCEHYHHGLLHSGSRREERPRVTSTDHVASSVDTTPCADTAPRVDTAQCADSAPHAVISNTSTPRTYNRVLLKVVPVTLSGPNGKVETFALLDDGSTITLLTTDVAQRIGAKGPNEPFYIEAVAGTRIDVTNSCRVKVNIRGKYTTEGIDIEARTIDRLELSSQSIRANDLVGFDHLTPIVEQLSYDTGVPTVLIGQDNWALLLASEVRVGTKGQPVASRTPLGWALHGQTCNLTKVHLVPQIRECCSHVSTDETIEKLMQENYNARVHESDYPEAVNSIVRNHYMDDYLQSFDDAEEANRVSKAVNAVHRRGNFTLQKWASNEPAAIAGLATEPAEADTLLNKEEKILGLIWRHHNDSLGFNFRKVDPSYLDKQVTKRQLLKTAMSLYDPLGLAAPFTTQAKCIMQDTWRLNIGWDERLPKSLERKWHDWLIALQILKGVRIPRCYPGFNNSTGLELHVFVDVSERAYAAAAYWRSVNDIGQVNVSLAAAKGRVAPLKVTSIPRLELQAAVLGGRLARCVEEEHDRRADRRVFWSDSRTVLAWLRAGARAFKPFVAHRVAELEETTQRSEWRWVPTAHNVADDSTRDTPSHFTASHRWYTGPSFLYDDENAWPQETNSHPSLDTGEERVTTVTAHQRSTTREALPDVTRFSSWLRLIRATARVLQFIDRLRVHTTAATRKRNSRVTTDDPNWKAQQRETTRTRSGAHSRNLSVMPTVYIPLGTQYTRRAEFLWTRAIQEECFPEELRHVTGGRAVPADSRLNRLSLTVDEHNIIRIRSRIAAPADISRETQSPSALNATLIDRHPYEDVLHTLLTEVEHTVNSRPLTHVSVNPDDEEALTPNHFLLGAPTKVPLPGNFTRPDELRHSHWRASQRLADLFWQRWLREVLPTLQNRREPHGRGDTVKVGDLVVVVDPNLPRNIWPKGRVERVYPGADGIVRVVDVKTKSGTMRRPVKRLVVIPVE